MGEALLEAPSDETILSSLERLAEDTEDWAALAKIYRTVAAGRLGIEQQVDLRCRLGRLYSQNLGELDRAIATYRRILDLSPRRDDVATALEGLYVRTERWEELADYLTARDADDRFIDVLAAHLPAGSDEQVGSYLQVAQVCEERLDAPDKAIEAASRALALDPNSLSASNTLFRLYYQAEQYEECLDTLELQIDALPNDDERIAVLERMTELCEQHLRDLDRAAECVENILLIDDQRLASYQQLAGYYQQLNAHSQLADCYERHSRAEPDPARKADLLAQTAAIYSHQLYANEPALWALKQLAEVCEQKLDEPERAIAAYCEILELDPNHHDAAQALDRLYTRAERWQELVDLLVIRAASVPTEPGPERDAGMAAGLRLAEIYDRQLGDVGAALAGYQELLELDPTFEPARAAVAARLSDPEHGRTAAQLLEPIYLATDDWAALIQSCQVLCEHTSDPWERSRLWVRVAGLELERDDPRAALLAYERALAEDASGEPIWDDMYELAAAHSSWQLLAEVLERLVARPLSDPALAALQLVLGRVYRDHLDAPARAIDGFRAALELSPNTVEAGEALEALYAHTKRWAELAEYLAKWGNWDTLIDVASRHLPDDPAQQFQQYLDIAGFCEQHLDDPEQAVEAAEQALALDSSSLPALHMLFRLYQQRGSHERCLDMLELELDLSSGDEQRIDVLQRIAALCDAELNDIDKSAECVEKILSIDDKRTAQYQQLAGYYRRMNAWQALADCYQRHIAAEPDPTARADLKRALLSVYRDQLEDHDAAAQVAAELSETTD
ncbi:MAG: hypothetical protein Tsb0020_05330 [Haliangiales bacterium]